MRLSWNNIVEQAIGTIIGSAAIALGVYLFGLVTGTNEASLWLWFGLAALVVSTVVAFFWQSLRALLVSTGRWIISHWRLVVGALLLSSVMYLAFRLTRTLSAVFLVLGLVLAAVLLTHSYAAFTFRHSNIAQAEAKRSRDAMAQSLRRLSARVRQLEAAQIPTKQSPPQWWQVVEAIKEKDQSLRVQRGDRTHVYRYYDVVAASDYRVDRDTRTLNIFFPLDYGNQLSDSQRQRLFAEIVIEAGHIFEGYAVDWNVWA